MDYDRLRGQTERETTFSMLFGEITEDELLSQLGDYPRTRSILEDYHRRKNELQNPGIYWDGVISNLKAALESAEASRAANETPPWWFREQSGHDIPTW